MGAPAGRGSRVVLSTADAVAVIVGVVVGAGIFRLPSLVAANSPSEGAFLGLWLGGGLLALVGAWCYAELGAAYPHHGGDYDYLRRAYGPKLAFLFAWARVTVIQSGSIAALAFVCGDYLAGGSPWSSGAVAAAVVLGLTWLNLLGARPGARTQAVLTVIKIAGLLAIAALGCRSVAAPTVAPLDSHGPWSLALVFVLFTYGGWNEAAYLSAELPDRRATARALHLSVGLLMGLYLLVNVAFLRLLGLGGIAASEAVAADAARVVAGPRGAALVAALVAVACLGAANASIFTGARTVAAFGEGTRHWRALGVWSSRGAPVVALWAQGLVTLGLVVLGTLTRQGLETAVAYTAPVFWLFFGLTGLALLRLRRLDPDAPRPFTVPGYPVTPLLFAAVCAFMFWSSVLYAGTGALLGLVVLLAGALLMRTAAPLDAAEL